MHSRDGSRREEIPSHMGSEACCWTRVSFGSRLLPPVRFEGAAAPRNPNRDCRIWAPQLRSKRNGEPGGGHRARGLVTED